MTLVANTPSYTDGAAVLECIPARANNMPCAVTWLSLLMRWLEISRGTAAYLVMWGDGKQFGWLDPADIVLNVENKLEDQLKELKELKASFLSGFDVLSADLAPEKMSWLNNYSNHQQSMCEVIDFKNHCLEHQLKLDEGYTLRIHAPPTSTLLPGRDERRLLPRCCPSVQTLTQKTRPPGPRFTMLRESVVYWYSIQ